MITNFKLFEKKDDNPWDYDIPSLNKLKNSLEIEIYDGEEWVILYHYGSHKAWIDKKLDPKYMGTGQLTREDQSQLPFKVVMFYVSNDDTEQFFNIQNNDLFKIKYPLKKLYPMYSDPLNLLDKVPDSEFISLNTPIKKVMIGSKDLGFDGTISNWKTKNEKNVYRCEIWKIIPLEEPYLIEHQNAGYLSI